jgi:transcriptional regulator GlxA family with amidase domain
MKRSVHSVAVLALDGVVGFDLAIPCQVFASTVVGDRGHPYDVRVCGPGPSVAATSSGVEIYRLEAPYPLAEAVRCDTVIVPGMSMDGRWQREAVEVLRAAHAAGARIASICTGAFVLAEAGLLDGRRATTHWADAPELAARFPQVCVDPAVLYIDDGDLLTSAGVAAGLDLCLHMVRTDHGSAVAAETARMVVMTPQRDGGQAQFIRRTASGDGDGGALEATMHWMREHLEDPLTLSDIAGHARLSVRTLSRRFHEETGTSPTQWLIGQRVDRARELLETTELSVEQVAGDTGFGSAVSLRPHFQRLVGTAPIAYRRAFQDPSESHDAAAG